MYWCPFFFFSFYGFDLAIVRENRERKIDEGMELEESWGVLNERLMI